VGDTFEMKYLIALIVFVVLSPSVSMGAVLTFSCKYPTFSSDEEFLKKDNTMAFLVMVDTITGESFMIGNLGRSKLELHLGEEAWTFSSKLVTGAMQTITIVKDSLVSVHSRHSVIFGEITPSQYYGKCKRL
jgi:hypothetical protein